MYKETPLPGILNLILVNLYRIYLKKKKGKIQIISLIAKQPFIPHMALFYIIASLQIGIA